MIFAPEQHHDIIITEHMDTLLSGALSLTLETPSTS